MPRKHLTDMAVRQLKHPESGDVKYRDAVVSGFGVRVSARSKSWFIMRGQRRQLTTTGKCPEISLQDARKKANAPKPTKYRETPDSGS